MSSKHKKTRSKLKHQSESVVHNVYPNIPGYPMPSPPQWIHPHPNANYPYQWYQPWQNLPNMNQNALWRPPVSTVSNKSSASSKSTTPPEAPDEFTVDSMRRIYNNNDGSIEIERVKVQRRQGIYDKKQNLEDFPSESRSLVPVSSVVLNDRRPPPRKHKRKDRQLHDDLDKKQDILPIQGWYPYMPYIPQPIPYAYPYGYVWPIPPPPSTVAMSPGCDSPTDESDSSASHPDPFPTSIDSTDILAQKSRSSEFQRPSSAAGSHITESLGTDLAPSDSVSMRGYKRENSFERILRKSFPNQKQPDKTPTDNFHSTDLEKTREWMQDMQKAFDSKTGMISGGTGDRSSFTTAPSDIPTPPMRAKNPPNSSPKVILTHRKSNSESNIDSQDDQRNSYFPLLENTRVSESDLMYVLNKIEKTDNLRDKGSFNEGNDINKGFNSLHPNGRDSRNSTASFHSTRQSTEEHLVDTDSTDIAIPIDSSTADESIIEDDITHDDLRSNYKWVLQESEEETWSENEESEGKPPKEITEAWRTEVSLWRARLVVSLCRGQGLDQQDWSTFHLLVQHPLPMGLKLSLLHARRICSQNYDVGVALLRNSLLHLTTFGETLMKPKEERTPGWKVLTVDSNQPWVLIKGSREILRIFGYRMKENGVLKYKQKYSPETSVIARLTLDLLVLAEEFRLFLSGAHKYPCNLTQLFSPQQSSFVEESETRYNNDRNPGGRGSEHDNEGNKDDSHDIVATSMQMREKDFITPLENERRDHAFFKESEKTSHQLSMSPIDSLPELHSLSRTSLKAEISDKESGSRETLTATPTPHTKEEIAQKNKSKEKSSSEENEILDDMGTSRETFGKGHRDDNPEDHVYEEIGDIKEQVQALKRGDSSSKSPPPPLPPKAKSSNNQDIYPHVDWSISSNYSSIHEGSVTKRKKRRAPVPPDLFTSPLKPSKDNIESEKTSFSQSPALQNKKEKLEKENAVNKNPFYEESIRPAGYVGKNPFYEDLDKKYENHHSQPTSNKGNLVIVNEKQNTEELKDVGSSYGPLSNRIADDISEISSCSSLPPGVRPQRRKKKTNLILKSDMKLNENVKPSISTEVSESKKDIPSNHQNFEEANKANVDFDQKAESGGNKKFFGEDKTKNEGREHQCDSQVAVPNNTLDTEGTMNLKSNIDSKRDVILKKISITYDISLDDKDPNCKKLSSNSSKLIQNKNNLSKTDIFLKEKNDGPNEDSKAVHSTSKSLMEEEKEPSNNDRIESPPLPPPKAALRLIDDIPYIDTNDVKYYKSKVRSLDRKQQPHYGLVDLNITETINLSTPNAEGKTSSFLKRSSLVPFIDDYEFPPKDSPPPPLPPPPTSPPPSPLSLFSQDTVDNLKPIEELISECPPLRRKNSDCKDLDKPSIACTAKSEQAVAEKNETIWEEKLLKTDEKINTISKTDPSRKSLVRFGKKVEDQVEVIYQPNSESSRYEIAELPKTLTQEETEERYEIPDVSKANEFSNEVILEKKETDNKNCIAVGATQLVCLKMEETLPKRPPRHLLLQKPPPRPPKPSDIEFRPALPPKTGSLKSSKSFSKNFYQATSLPSTLTKPYSKTITPSPLAIPKMYSSSTASFRDQPPINSKALSLSSVSNSTNNNNNINKNEPVSQPEPIRDSLETSNPVPECTSLPSSPKASKSNSIKKKKKRQKSLPSLICDCVYPQETYDDIKYIVK